MKMRCISHVLSVWFALNLCFICCDSREYKYQTQDPRGVFFKIKIEKTKILRKCGSWLFSEKLISKGIIPHALSIRIESENMVG